MRVTLTANTPGGVISDWAWEDSGSFILAGIPEPGRAMLVMLGGLLAFGRRCRRREGRAGPVASLRGL